jgi:hypothetical protein
MLYYLNSSTMLYYYIQREGDTKTRRPKVGLLLTTMAIYFTKYSWHPSAIYRQGTVERRFKNRKKKQRAHFKQGENVVPFVIQRLVEEQYLNYITSVNSQQPLSLRSWLYWHRLSLSGQVKQHQPVLHHQIVSSQLAQNHREIHGGTGWTKSSCSSISQLIPN